MRPLGLLLVCKQDAELVVIELSHFHLGDWCWGARGKRSLVLLILYSL
jgi:hypothetical protein